MYWKEDMKYTQYFAQIIKQYGAPQLPNKEMSSFLNIVHLEAKKQVYSGLNVSHHYSIHIRVIDDEIEKLTGGLTPQELIKRWENGDPIKSKVSKEENTPWDDNDRFFYPKKSKY